MEEEEETRRQEEENGMEGMKEDGGDFSLVTLLRR